MRHLSLILALLLCLCLCPAARAEGEDPAPEVFTSGDYEYILLEDGTAQITRYNGKVSDLVIPNALDDIPVTSIGDEAFGFNDLTSVIIPDSVISMGINPFYYCKKLTSIQVSRDHPVFTTIDNVLFEKTTKKLICYPLGKTEKSYAIPQGIQAIGDAAFYSSERLTSITIPDSIISMGINPFADCWHLNSFSISPNHPVFSVVDGVLFEKTTKTLICYPKGKTGSRYAIPQGVEVIGSEAFYECYSLTGVTIPDSVTAIGESAFCGCFKLTSVTIPGSVTAIGDRAFIRCTGLTGTTIPGSVTTIGASAFAECESLTRVTILDGVTTIGDKAFYFCKNLKSVTISDGVTTIGDEAFSACSSLTSISIPDSVTSMGSNPFAYCERLTSFNVSPDHPVFAIIDNVLFEKASRRLICYPNGKTGKSYVIPQGIQMIGDGAFYGCSSLASITIPDSVTTIGSEAFSSCRGLSNVTIPDGVTTIGDHAFYGCSGLTSVTIPDGVTTISDHAFCGCSGLTSVAIPDGVTTIGVSAFSYCDNLASVTIPDSVTFIGKNAFHRCPNLIVTVSRNSYAFQYCQNNEIPCVYPDSNNWLNP